MKKHSGIGIGIDNKCAIEFIGDKCRIISADNNSNAYKVYKSKGKIKTEKLPKKEEFSSIDEIYSK